ncbi:MBL fold metallo-hydrolase [Citricoccus parietis]|uniref:MBL fold metallo-hydrolase n=1 Tax=Citricoccus parietis TaxID=592307 RepID=A0ABV5G7C3_9MICC
MAVEAAAKPRTSRRAVLAGGLGTAAAMGLSLPASAAAHPRPSAGRTPLELVLLGTRGGLPPSSDRSGIASVVTVEGRNYQIDCGYASAWQYQRAGLKRQDLAGIFITHLHADHVADYYNTILMGAVTGLPYLDVVPDNVPAYGPGPAGGLPDKWGGGTAPTINPANPTPGLVEMTNSLHAAYAYSSNVFMRDAGMRDISELVTPHEIVISEVGASPRGDTAPRMSPFVVMEDDRVRVSATLVPHGPVYPSFAYRFDTDHGSVTFSGDTRKSENLIELAAETDILVHEAISDPAEVGISGPILTHMLESHVLVDEVGTIAQAAAAKHLVLSHLGDFTGEIKRGKWQRAAQRGYSGKVTVGEDLQRIPLRHRRR